MKKVEPLIDERKGLSLSEKVMLTVATVGLVAIGALMVVSTPPV